MTLTLDALGFIYRGAANPTLTDINLSLEPQRMHAVVGPLSSGTSTLCRVVAGLLTDRGSVSGTLRLEGTAIMLGDDPETQLSGMTSVVGDEVQLPGRFNGEEPATAESRARTALNELGIADLWTRRLETLSGGQRQLVALASLLTLRPRVLVLDQPALSLDPQTRGRLIAALHAFCEAGGAVLLAAHQLDDLTEACDQVSILEAGQLTMTCSSVTQTQAQQYGIWDSRNHCDDQAKQRGAACGDAHEAPQDDGTKPPAERSSATRSSVFSARGLSVVRGQATVFDSVGFDLGAGELVTIMGPNGAGKSTLLRHLVDLIEPGTYAVGTMVLDPDGEALRFEGLPTYRRAPLVGWVGQDPGSQLLAATVQAEVEGCAPLPPHRRKDRAAVRAQRHEAAASAMMVTGLTEVCEMHPYDLNIARRKDVVLATALVSSPRILLLDEPTLGRDHGAIAQLNVVISEFLLGGGAIIATTHDRRWAKSVSGRILHLEAGHLSPTPAFDE